MDRYMWWSGNSYSTAAEVGLEESNLRGLFDMYGNIREICQDCGEPYFAEPQTDPVGPHEGQHYVIRGAARGYNAVFGARLSRLLILPGLTILPAPSVFAFFADTNGENQVIVWTI